MNATPSAPSTPTRWEHAILRVPGLRSTPPPAASPRVFAPHRALWLAAECLGLKAMLIAAQARITTLEKWPRAVLWLADECRGLKAMLIAAQTRITALEEEQRTAQAQHSRDAEKIAELHRRNEALTRALHRTACAG